MGLFPDEMFMKSIGAVSQVPLAQMVLLLDLAPAVLVSLQFPSDRPAWSIQGSIVELPQAVRFFPS